MIKMEDHEDEHGKLDWKAYGAAQVANGDICSRCRSYVTALGVGHPRECYDCQALDKPEEVTHNDTVRCPDCGYTWGAHGGDDYDHLGDGEHNMMCPDCDHEFEISTSVSWSFTSPARLEKKT